MLLRSISLLATLWLLSIGCGDDDSDAPLRSGAERDSGIDVFDAGGCPAPAGSAIDVRSEPWSRKFLTFEWTDVNGCIVRIDVVSEYQGSGHCGFQDTRVITVGDPVGARFSGPADAREYVRDPSGAYGDRALAEAFEPNAIMPLTALDTGFRRGELELWVDPEDDTVIYLKEPTKVERWPRGDPPPCF